MGEGNVFTAVCHSVHKAGLLWEGVCFGGGSALGGREGWGLCLGTGGGGLPCEVGLPGGADGLHGGRDTVNWQLVRILLEYILA